MTVLQFLLTFLVPALGGLIIGFPAGVIAALYWVGRRRERGEPVPIYTDDDNPNPGRTPWRGREHLSRLGWLLVILGVIGFVAGLVALVQNNDTAGCLRNYIEQTSAASQERAEAAELDRQAIRQQRAVSREFNQVMIDAVTNPATDQAARDKARTDFLVKARDWDARLAEVDRLDQQAEAQRQQNPLPPRPDC